MALTKVTSGLISASASSVDLNIDAGTLYIDATNNRVGVANTSPATALDVTGTVTADAAKIENSTTSTVTISESTGIGTAELRFVATESFPKTKIVTDVSAGSLSLETLGNERLNISNNGDISFYEDTGTTPKFFWDASAEALGIGTSSPSATLDVNGTIKLDGNYPVGTNNVALGDTALSNATSADSIVAVGFQAALSNTSGSANTAVGRGSLYTNSTGNNNTGIGYQALVNNTTASSNTVVGYQAAYSNTTGTLDAFGDNALRSNTTGGFNSAFGRNSQYNTTTGTNNAAFGSGGSGVYAALQENSTGSYNTAIGISALGQSTTASNNTAVGYQAGYYVTTGTKNTILGRYSGNQDGLDIRTSSNNIVLSDGDGLPGLRLQKLGSGYKNRWRPVYQGDATGYGSGAAANTWHEITAVEFNAVDYVDSSIKVYISFQNGNPTYGYVGLVMCEIPNVGSNVAYTGACIIGTDVSGTSGYQIPTTVATHTGTSSVYFELKMELTGSSKHLFIRSNVAQTTNTSAFGVPQMLVVIDGWIPD